MSDPLWCVLSLINSRLLVIVIRHYNKLMGTISWSWEEDVSKNYSARGRSLVVETYNSLFFWHSNLSTPFLEASAVLPLFSSLYFLVDLLVTVVIIAHRWRSYYSLFVLFPTRMIQSVWFFLWMYFMFVHLNGVEWLRSTIVDIRCSWPFGFIPISTFDLWVDYAYRVSKCSRSKMLVSIEVISHIEQKWSLILCLLSLN